MTRALLLSLLLSACCGDPDAFSVKGGQEYEEAFQTASQAWCEASDGACCPYRDDDGPSLVRPATAEELEMLFPSTATTEPSGWATHGGGGPTTILILDTMPAERIQSVVLHELGHHCGCGDTQRRGLVMTQTTDYRAVEITEEDAACAR